MASSDFRNVCTPCVYFRFFGHLFFDSSSSTIMACALGKLKYNFHIRTAHLDIIKVLFTHHW